MADEEKNLESEEETPVTPEDSPEEEAAPEPAAENDAPEPAQADADGAPRKKKTGRKKKAPKVTAGERHAAAKAAKAAKKAAERAAEKAAREAAEAAAEEDDFVDPADEVEEQAEAFFEKHFKQIAIGTGALLGAAAIWGAVNHFTGGGNPDAAALLVDAQDTASAAIVAEGEDAPEGVDEHYATRAARAAAAAPEFQAVISGHGDSGAAVEAYLGLGRAELEQGNWAAAREAFEGAVAAGGSDNRVAARAYEGIAFAHEAEDNWDEALSAYSELSDLGDSNRLLADYHRARVHIAKGEEVEAKELLQSLLGSLDEEDAPELAYVRDQAELRLMAIDPSLVQRNEPAFPGMGGMPGGGQQLPPELLELLRQQQQGAQ